MKGELCLEENIGVSKCVLVAPLGGHFRSYFRIFRFQKNKEFDFFKGDLSMKLEKDFFYFRGFENPQSKRKYL